MGLAPALLGPGEVRADDWSNTPPVVAPIHGSCGSGETSSATPLGARPDVGPLDTQLVGDASLALLLLVVVTTLSVFKPWGRTVYGQNRLRRGAVLNETGTERMPTGLKILFAVIAVIVVAFVALHLVGGGLAHHAH
jgi:hypothetical protein